MNFAALLPSLIDNSLSHAKWLNTLSYMENCGARKIARAEHPREVSKEMLKHASEEFRHAFYLKQQITTKLNLYLPNYNKDLLFGGHATLRYLDRLETYICRLLKKQASLCTQTLKYRAYLLVTYAIECRAAQLYPIYQELLIQARSPVSVRSILLEEKGHLEEMQTQLNALQMSKELLFAICAYEETLCRDWIEKMTEEQKTNAL